MEAITLEEFQELCEINARREAEKVRKQKEEKRKMIEAMRKQRLVKDEKVEMRTAYGEIRSIRGQMFDLYKYNRYIDSFDSYGAAWRALYED